MRTYIDLVEAMNYAVLLFEDRMAYLLKTLGPKIDAKFQQDTHPADIIAAVNNQAGETIPEKVVAYILSFDPSKNGQYTQWMVTRFLQGSLRLEDLEAAKESLATFNEMKTRRQLTPEQVDINKYRSLADLSAVIRSTTAVAVNAEASEEQGMLAQTKVLYDKADMRILVPETQEAACYFGRNTEWCTAWGYAKGRHPTRTNRYDSYAPSGPLFIIELRPEGTLYQYHSETGQFMDVDDRQLSAGQVMALLKAHPKIMPVIGEDRFVNSHLSSFGIGFFSEKALLKAIPSKIVQAVRRQADYDALPEALRNNPKFTAALLLRSESNTKIDIPPENLTPEVAEELRALMANHPVWSAFEVFPMKEWPIQAVEWATESGKLTYEQYMQLPEDQRSTEQLQRLITVSASRNPAAIASYPPGLIGRLGAAFGIVMRNPRVIEYLSADDLTEDDLVRLAEDKQFSSNLGGLRNLAYLPPDRVTDRVVAAINSQETEYNKVDPSTIQQRLFNTWKDLYNKRGFDDRNAKNLIDATPRRYINDPHFFESIVAGHTEDNRRYAREERNLWLKTFFQAIKGMPVSGKTLDELVKSIIVRDSYDRNHNHVEDSSIAYTWRPLLLSFQSAWTPEMVKSALTRKLLKPTDIPEELITPDVAGRLFRLDPANTALAYKADDQSLVDEIGQEYGYSGLINSIPDDRITEPIAFAAVTKGGVPGAKKRFPKAALSKRVYLAGVPWSFDLKDVPKSIRSDALIQHAVAKNALQLKFVPEPLAWLNANREALANTKLSHSWTTDIERLGIVQTTSGFEAITALPHDDIAGGYKLYKALLPKKEHRWFLRKGDNTVAILVIKNNKLRLMNERPAKDLTPAFRDIASRLLGNVGDISILNNIGIYRNPDQTVRDEEKARAELPKEVVEGIEWSASPHLKGKLYTAWKDNTPLLSVYFAQNSGWGSWRTKVQDLKVLNYKAAVANAKALIPGIEKIAREPGNGQWTLHNIGIGWSERQGYWLMADQKIGKIGNYTAYYSPSHRYLSIFSADKGVAAYGTILKNGKLAREQVRGWEFKDDAEMLEKTLTSLASKVTK